MEHNGLDPLDTSPVGGPKDGSPNLQTIDSSGVNNCGNNASQWQPVRFKPGPRPSNPSQLLIPLDQKK